jgi:hypothetical protein
MTPGSSAIVTVAFGKSTEHLDHTFLSFAEKNPSIPLHAFVIGHKLPERRLPQIQYHLVAPTPDFSHPLREVYFRRHELIDQLDVEFVLIVDSYDVLCLQPLPAFAEILAGFAMAAATEHMGSRYILGQGYTANFLNGGVTFWDLPKSRGIRREIGTRGRSHYRLPADDQMVVNEIVQTRYFDQVRILPSQFNYRAYLNVQQSGWPTVTHLNGVMIYHNGPCIDAAKRWLSVSTLLRRAELPPLPADPAPLSENEQFWRRVAQYQAPHFIRESLRFRFQQWLMGKRWFYGVLRATWPLVVRLRLDKLILKLLPVG